MSTQPIDYMQDKTPYIGNTKYFRNNVAKSFFAIIDNDVEEVRKGIYCITEKYNPKTEKTFTEYLRICSIIYIDKKIKLDSKSFYSVIYFDRNKENQTYIEAKDLLLNTTKNSHDIDIICNDGLIIEEKCRSLVLEYLKLTAPLVEEEIGTDKTGWQDGEYIGNGFKTSDIVYTGKSKVTFNKKGTEENQIAVWSDAFTDNPIVFFTTAYCFSGVISQFIMGGDYNPILALTGTSSKGKTTAEMFAYSSYTHPERFLTLNATAGNIETSIHNAQDLFVCLDESGQSTLKKDDKIGIIYNWANGKKKGRLTKIGNNYDDSNPERTNYSILICGEMSLLDGCKQTDGIKARFNEIVLSGDLKLWESMNDNKDAEELAYKLHQDYGHIMPLFINAVKSDLHLLRNKFVTRLDEIRKVLDTDSDIVNRKAKVLAYSYVSADYIADIIYPNMDPSDKRQIVYDMSITVERLLFADLMDFEESKDVFKDKLAHIEDTHQQFFITDRDDVNRKEVYGIITTKTDHKEILVVNNQWGKFCDSFEVPDSVFLQYVKDKGLLKKDKDNRSTISRNRKRYYCLIIPHSYFDEPIKLIKEEQSLIDDDIPIFDGER